MDHSSSSKLFSTHNPEFGDQIFRLLVSENVEYNGSVGDIFDVNDQDPDFVIDDKI